MGPIEVLEQILERNPGVTHVSTRHVQPGPLLQGRVSTALLPPLAARAQEIRQSMNVSFTDAINIAIADGYDVDAELVRAIMFQNDREIVRWHAVGEDWRGSVWESALDPQTMQVLSSAMKMRDGTIRHLTMMDFHIPASPAAQTVVELISREFAGPGWILESGRSYHYYGVDIHSFDEMAKVLGRALMFAPVTDRGWIAHQLVDGVCCLRLAEHPSKIGSPYVVADFSAA